jgi:hypothetical protein
MAAEHPALRLARMVIDGDALISQARDISQDSGGRAALLRARRLIQSAWPDPERVPSARDFSRAARILADGSQGGAVPRMIREEQVVAFVLRAPWELDAVSAALPWFCFAADVREEVFQAARLIHSRGGTVDARSVATEAASRYEWAPAWARDALGGPGTPSVFRYIARLAATEVSPGLARQAISALAASCPAPAGGARPVSPRHCAVLLDQRPGPSPPVIPSGPAPHM